MGPDFKDGYGATALAWASKKGHMDTIKVLLDAGKLLCIERKKHDLPVQTCLLAAAIRMMHNLFETLGSFDSIV